MEVLYINIVKMSTFFYIYYKNKFVLHDKLEKKNGIQCIFNKSLFV